MPSLLKDRATGRLGRLISALRPARAGPLPVQTGFPTSLADLFVKNHGRLRKPSSCASAASRRKKRGVPPSPSPPRSPAPSPPASSPPSPPPPAAVSPPAQPRPDLPPAAEPVCHTGGGSSAFGLGLGFLALVGVVMSLAILVIWSRKVVAAAATVTAFSLFLVEPIKSLLLRRRRSRPPAAKEALDLGGRGYVSPIREVEAEPEPATRSFSDLDRATDAASILSTEDTIEERSEAGDEAEEEVLEEADPQEAAERQDSEGGYGVFSVSFFPQREQRCGCHGCRQCLYQGDGSPGFSPWQQTQPSGRRC